MSPTFNTVFAKKFHKGNGLVVNSFIFTVFSLNWTRKLDNKMDEVVVTD